MQAETNAREIIEIKKDKEKKKVLYYPLSRDWPVHMAQEFHYPHDFSAFLTNRIAHPLDSHSS